MIKRKIAILTTVQLTKDTIYYNYKANKKIICVECKKIRNSIIFEISENLQYIAVFLRRQIDSLKL